MKQTISVENIYTISGDAGPLSLPLSDAARERTVIAVMLSGLAPYYRKYGDRRGLERLKRFRGLVAPLLAEYGLHAPIIIDDVVWVCFSAPHPTYQCAQAVLARIDSDNERLKTESAIQAKILIHHGETVLEAQRLFGAAIQLMLELLPLLPDDALCCTEIAAPKGDAGIELAPCPLPPEYASELPPVYRLIQARSRPRAASNQALLWLKRLPKYHGQAFLSAWNAFTERIANDPMFHEGESAIFDTELTLMFPDVSAAAAFAQHLPEYFAAWSEQSQSPLLPVQLLIDIRRRESSPTAFSTANSQQMADIEPGVVNITPAAYRSDLNRTQLHAVPPVDEQTSRFCHRLVFSEAEAADAFTIACRVLYRAGDLPPCFYCGHKDHAPPACPSKLLELADGRIFQTLGYMSPEDIKLTLIRGLTAAAPNHDPDAESIDAAHEALYELTAIFQLRQARIIMETEQTVWAEISANPKKTNGGRLWLAFDCLRTLKIERAQAILQDCLRESPHDFQVYLGLGLVSMEKQDSQSANDQFRQALYHTKTNPQRILSLLLCYRLNDLTGNAVEAEKALRQALQIDPRCRDAAYLSIKREISAGRLESALPRLKELIREDRCYYIRALIDPELAAAENRLSAELKQTYQTAKAQAETAAQLAGQQMTKLESLFGSHDPLMKEFHSIFELSAKYQQGDSYFGYLDIIRLADIILTRGKRIIEEQKQVVSHNLDQALRQCRRHSQFIRDYPYPGLISGLDRKIASLSAEAEALGNAIFFEQSARFRQGADESQRLLAEVRQIEPELRKLAAIIEIKRFIMAFGKLFLIIQALNGLVSFLVFPLITWLIVSGFLKLRMGPVYAELSPYIGGLFVIVGIFGALLAAVMTANKLYPE